MDEKTKKIKDMSSEEMTQFAEVLAEGDGTSAKVDKVPEFLSSSEELQRKTLRVDHTSGSKMMGFDLHRHDKAEEERGGFPINVDKYVIIDTGNGGVLFKRKLPFDDHKLDSLPEE